jgi:hypothetical protein
MVEEYFRQIEGADDHQFDWAEEDVSESMPLPKNFPITYSKLELLLLPKLKGRTAERAKIIREFLFVDYLPASRRE